MNFKEIEKLKLAVNQFYLGKYLDQPGLDDIEFDLLRTEYESTGLSIKDLVEWENKMTLRNLPMTSLNKSIVGNNDLKSAVKDYVKDFDRYHINLKYDGASICAYYDRGRLRKILSTPDAKFGIVRTKSFWNLFPKNLEDTSIIYLRGEVVVSHAKHGQLARNIANGLTNSEYKEVEVSKEAFIRIYEIGFKDSMEFDYDRLDYALKNLPTLYRQNPDGSSDTMFESAYQLSLDEIPTDTLVSLRNGDNFQCDGVVVYSNKGIKGFKYYFTESAITIVNNINYNFQSNGSYSAVLNIDRVTLNDKSINNVSSNGIPNLISMKMGKGAKVRVILANLTIPKIIEVLEPSENYQFPKCSCGYQMDEKDIFGSTLKCGNTVNCERRSLAWTNESNYQLINRLRINPELTLFNDMLNNFDWWMNILHIDRWTASSKIYKGFTKDMLISDLSETIIGNDCDKFERVILNGFYFSGLNKRLALRNINTAFHVMRELYKEFKQNNEDN